MSVPGCLEAYVVQMLEDPSSLTEEAQLKESVRVYLAALRGRRLRESLNGLGAPPGLTAIQTFQSG